MVATYTLHVPADAEPGDPEGLDRAELVKDGFSWGAFLFTFLWFFWNRLWLAGLGVLVAVIGLPLALQVLRIDAGAAVLAEVLLMLLIGFEANSLRRWSLQRRKPISDVVTAADREEAETKAFSRWLENTGEPRLHRLSVSFPAPSYRSPEPVIGLFPDTERAR
jgi:hypothetical protein